MVEINRNPPIQERIAVVDGLLPRQWVLWFQLIRRLMGIVNNDLSVSPPTIADADALNNSIYYSSTASKLVYKDSGGTVHNLY